MVVFYDITFDEDWVYAIAEDYGLKQRGRVKIHRRDEIVEYELKTFDIMKACSNLVVDVNDGKIKQNSQKSYTWG